MVKGAGEGVVAAVFAGFAYLEAALGFNNGRGVRLGGRLSLTVAGGMGYVDSEVAAADDLAGADRATAGSALTRVAGEVFFCVNCHIVTVVVQPVASPPPQPLSWP